VGFTAHQTAEVIDLLSRATGKFIQSATHRIIKNRNWLIIAPVKTMEAQNILIQEGDERIHFAGGILNFKKIPALNFQHSTSIMIAQLDAAQIKYPLLLRKWKQGDYFYPFGTVDKLTGKIGKKKLNRFFTNQKLSKTEKESVWVIEMDKKITWVVGMRLDNRFRITSSTKEILSIQFIKNGDEATG
jgi:tRNA(Ile)-lysidine synthase